MRVNRTIRASGGVLYRITDTGRYDLLLIWRNGVWDLPKGKMEPGESPERCALREVHEETGVPSLDSKEFLAETYHEYSEGDDTIGKTTFWFIMTTDDPDFQPVPQTDEGIEKVEWIELGAAKKAVGYENLVRLLDLFGSRVRDNKR